MGMLTYRRLRAKQQGGEKSPPVLQTASLPKFTCPKCGKDCKIKMAFTNHTKACKG